MLKRSHVWNYFEELTLAGKKYTTKSTSVSFCIALIATYELFLINQFSNLNLIIYQNNDQIRLIVKRYILFN